jgi:hypothetical protein
MTNCIIAFEKTRNNVIFKLSVKDGIILKTLDPDVCAAGVYAIDAKFLQFKFGRGSNRRMVDAKYPLRISDAFYLIDHLEGFECIKLMKLIQSSIFLQSPPTVEIKTRFEEALVRAITELPRNLVVSSRTRPPRQMHLGRTRK